MESDNNKKFSPCRSLPRAKPKGDSVVKTFDNFRSGVENNGDDQDSRGMA